MYLEVRIGMETKITRLRCTSEKDASRLDSESDTCAKYQRSQTSQSSPNQLFEVFVLDHDLVVDAICTG